MTRVPARTLFEEAARPMLVVDRRGVVVEANAEARALAGSDREVRGRPIDDLGAGIPIPVEILEPVWRGERVEIERSGRDLESGGRRDLFVEARRIDSGDDALALLTLTDATRSRVALETLDATRQRLRLLMGQMPAGLWTTDTGLRFTSLSGSALTDAGLEESDLLGEPLAVLIGEDHPGIDAHRGALEGRSVFYETTWADRTYEVHVEPFRQEDGRIIGVIGVALDITERRRTEEELEDKTAYLTQLFEESPEAIVLLDEDDRVLRINREFTRMFGYADEEALGRRINDLIVPSRLHEEASSLSERISSGDDVNAEAVRCRKDGSTLHVSILGTPIEVKDGRHIYGTYRDITERRELERQLVQSQKLEAVGRLAGGIAHDFNNLMTAVLGHARLVREAIDDAEMSRDLEEIERSAERAADLTRQLLTFSRKDVGRPRAVDLDEVVTEMDRLLRRLIGEDVDMVTDLAGALPSVEGDPAQLEQVIMNLAVNARDAMPRGGRLTIRTRNVPPGVVDAPAIAEGPLVVLSVLDTGVGMSPEVRNRMFEPFYTTKSPGKGTGLGLATVYGIVESMRGHIDVRSRPGEGTQIRVHFPVCASSRPERPPAAEGPEDLSAGDETILLVEDEPSVRRMARRTLQRYGYRVLTAEDAESALALLESGGVEIDLLVSDVVMPGMSGHELGSRVRSDRPGLRAIFMSGYTDVPGVPPQFEEGEARFLPKPFSPDTLARTARELLGR